jgi:hypothetical protein
MAKFDIKASSTLYKALQTYGECLLKTPKRKNKKLNSCFFSEKAF